MIHGHDGDTIQLSDSGLLDDVARFLTGGEIRHKNFR